MTSFGKTAVGEQHAEWALTDGQITVLGFGGDDGIDMARVRSVLPEYHGLWCAVSEQARVLGLKEHNEL